MTFSCCSSKTNYVWINQSCCCLQDTSKDKSKMEAELISKYLWRRWCRNRELKQPRRRRQQKPQKFAYLTVFLHALHVHFHLLTFWKRSRSFYDVKWPVLQLSGRREHMMTNVQFVLLSQKRWFQFNSRIVRTHFASVMTLNNCEIIAETRSYIFRWRSRSGRRCLCLSSLMYYPGVYRVFPRLYSFRVVFSLDISIEFHIPWTAKVMLFTSYNTFPHEGRSNYDKK